MTGNHPQAMANKIHLQATANKMPLKISLIHSFISSLYVTLI